MHLIKSFFAALTLVATTPAHSSDVLVQDIPTGWRLQDYTNGSIDVWYTSSSCINGHLTLPATLSSDVKNRFWSLVMTAKIAKKTIALYYDNATPECVVTNFFFIEQP